MRKVIILLAALVMLFGLTACGGTEMIEEQPVETAYIDTIYGDGNDDGYLGEYKVILDMMESSEAQFFYVDCIEPEMSSDYFEIYQTDNATFDEKVANVYKAGKASKIITKGFNSFFNSGYDSIAENANDETNAWFGDMQIDNDVVEWSGDYIKDNKIKLSCEEVNPSKLAIMHFSTTTEDPNGEPCVEQNAYLYFFVGTADVTTVEKESDPMGYFAEVGEIKTVTVKSVIHINDFTKDMWIADLYLQ